MVKINPIGKEFVSLIKGAPLAKSTPVKIPYKAAILPAATCPLIFSTQYRDFSRSIDEENYFQLKIDENTGKPFKPDVFQTTSANYLYNNDDVVVTAPTGTGKTAIAEYVMTKNLKDGKRTFYTTPLKALSNEKFRDFSKVYGAENVGLLTGDMKVNIDAPIVIMTTEVYRNMLLSTMFDKDSPLPEDLKTVIFDELQYLGDIDRGGIWEQSIMFTPKKVQMLSLSATAKNAGTINDWMAKIRSIPAEKAVCDGSYKSAEAYKHAVWVDVPAENRHVPLEISIENTAPEMKKSNSQHSYKKKEAQKAALKKSKTIYAKPSDDAYSKLTMKLFNEDKLPAIYFVFSKKDSRNLLKHLSSEITLTTKEERKEIGEIIQKYARENKYLGVNLDTDALYKGFALHNAGLLPTQKELVEELFQKKLVKVAIATETLSAGINMPARTTVISSPRKPASSPDGSEDGKRNLTPNEFHQMAGRAGRRGIDVKGFCLPLSCNTAQNKIFESLKESSSNDLISNFKFDFSFIANYLSNYSDDAKIKEIISRTLYGFTNKYMREELYEQYAVMKNILETKGFVKDGKMTLKGELLKHVNGYEQIPIIKVIADKDLKNLSPIELAGAVSALANIVYNDSEKYPLKPYEIENESVNLVKLTQKIARDIANYHKDMKGISSHLEMGISADTVNHVYEWAKLNNLSENSRQNWHKLCTGKFKDSIKDEGSLFKEIAMTVDLMKQMCTICDYGRFYSNDSEYYDKLRQALLEAISLLQREPVDIEHL